MDKKDIIYECNIENLKGLEDGPGQYRVLRNKKTRSGIIIVGKYDRKKRKWVFNPNARQLVVSILKELKETKSVLREVNEFLQAGPFNKINKGHFLHKKIKEALRVGNNKDGEVEL
ncbi:hypothetical protein KAR91_31145 [Candidatus Pacearchaeota archaeon]|nr:hypothetical protein [Candidatus Pacearchaeota archaeon]